MAEYIEREAAIAVCSAQYKECLRKSDWCGDTVAWNIGFNLKAIPAADVVEVKHGRWVWDENAMDWGLGGWVCSECEEKNDNIPAKPDIHPSGWVGSHYCPNCGARMDGE